MHPPDIGGIVGIAKQAPFGKRQGLAVRGREIRLLAQTVRLVNEILE
ncbi:hypothetical protein AB0C84_03450 [Actinomadura sp. NPDC048955]